MPLIGVKEKVIELRANNPCATLQFIGDKISVTRERVRQILKGANKPTIHLKPKQPKHLCVYCEKEVSPSICLFKFKGKMRYHKYYNKYCSSECRYNDQYIRVSCSTCGILFIHSKKELTHKINRRNYNHFFCSRKCLGQYTGNHYGFIIHPENIALGCQSRKGISKYPNNICKTIALLRNKGMSWRKISIKLIIPEGTVYRLYKRTINNA